MKKRYVSKTIRDLGNGIKVVERAKIKGTDYPLHWHDYYEIQIITSGHGVHIHNSNCTEYGRGSAWILSYCDCHGFEYESNTFAVSIVFDESMISRELASFVFAGISKYNCVFASEELKEVLATAKRLKAEAATGGVLNTEMSSALLTDILIRIIRASDADAGGEIPSYVQRVVSYVYKNFRNDVSLKDLGKELSLSAQYLGVQFKEVMGMTFKSYLNEVRLRYCSSLIETSDLSVKEIAFSGGYNSVEYFLQVFKKKYGITPMEYRKQAKALPEERG